MYDAVLQSHRSMQAEKKLRRRPLEEHQELGLSVAGVGIWRENGRTRVVTDFYRP